MSVQMSEHYSHPSVTASASDNVPDPGILTQASDVKLVTCVLCPEPGLVPAFIMSSHLLKQHQGMVFECAACKVSEG